jgi:hypothetical protein
MTTQQITKYLDSKPVSKTKLQFKKELSELRVLTILDGCPKHLDRIKRFTGKLCDSVRRSERQRLVWRTRHDTSKGD